MATEGYRDYRPKYHYTPEKGWINDPNGLVFDGEKYHLFAQHYPDATKWGPMHWAHAVSRDLLSWERLPIALYPDKLGMCFSGSACMYNGNPALMYTSHGDEECQSVAFTEDGVNFVPYPGNPVIKNPGIRDFRDPKLFWNAQRSAYGVAVASGDRVNFYASGDLIKWEKTGEFSDQKHITGVHECPDVFPLTAPNGETVYVMIASMILPEGGNRTQYVLGDFDGSAFRITQPFPAPEWIDAGWDNYAPVTFWGAEEKIMIGWASNWRYAHKLPTGEYAGAMTFPRKLTLTETDKGLQLSQTPLIDGITGAYAKTDKIPGERFRMRLRAEGDFAITMISEAGEKLTIKLENSEYIIDRRLSGERGDAPELLNEYGISSRARYMSGPTEMDITFDSSILEAFADKGTWAATMVAFPTHPYAKIVANGCDWEIAPL